MSTVALQKKALELFARAALHGMRNDAKLEPFMLAEILGFEVQDFHHVWLDTLVNNRKTLILAPRGHGKSTIATIVFALWKIIKDPNVRILIASATMEEAAAAVRMLGHIIEGNAGFGALFDDLGTIRWNYTRLTVRRRRICKEATITAGAANHSAGGRHFDVIIADDVVSEENSRCKALRARLRAWFAKTLLPSLEPDGELHLIGTRHGAGDLYGEIMRRNADNAGPYEVLVDRAVRQGRALWPGRFPLDLLEEIRNEIGPEAFECRYNNNPGGIG